MSDDLLKPEEIEALLKAAGARGPSDASKPPGASSTGQGGSTRADPRPADPLGMGALIQEAAGASASTSAANPASTAERLLQQAEAGLAAAISPNLQERGGISSEFGSPAPFQFQPFDQPGALVGGGLGISALEDVELDLRIELGRTELLIEEVLQLKQGSVVPLNKLAGDPVDILVNGRLIARGEVLVLNDNFCVRIAEILAPAL